MAASDDAAGSGERGGDESDGSDIILKPIESCAGMLELEELGAGLALTPVAELGTAGGWTLSGERARLRDGGIELMVAIEASEMVAATPSIWWCC